MPVGYESYEAKVYEHGINALANSATFQALVGAIDATGAKSFIIEMDGGIQRNDDTDENNPAPKATACDGTQFSIETAAHGLIACDPFPVSDPATSFEDRRGTTRIEIMIPPTEVHTAPEAYRNMLNIAGKIRKEIADWHRARALGSVSLDPRPLQDSTGYLPKHKIAQITIDWRTA